MELSATMFCLQENANCRVALLSITAAGAGITLTAANLVVFAELSWTPGEGVSPFTTTNRPNIR